MNLRLAIGLLATAVAVALHAAPPQFVRIGETYTLVKQNEKPLIVTLRQDAGNGWYLAQPAGASDLVYVNLSEVSMIVPGTHAVAASVNVDSIKKSIMNNLRQLSAAADQYFLELGVSQVAARELIGNEPKKFIRELKSLDGEDYLSLVITQGKPVKVKTKSGLEVEYRN